jgi:hypothetical protein
MVCFGSVQLAAKAPDVRSPYAQDGTEAHELLTYALENKFRSADEAYKQDVACFGSHTFRTDDREARVDSVQYALDEIWTVLDAFPNAKMGIETLSQFPSLVTDQCYGYSDIWVYVPEFNFVYVFDFKHGAGVAVDAEGNTQTFIYATGILRGLNSVGVYPDFVVPTIIQPRAFHPSGRMRRDVISAEYLRNVFVPMVDRAIMECEKPDAPLVPGLKQCRFCPAFTICPAREAQALQVANENFRQISDVTKDKLPDVRSLPVDRIAYILPMLDMLEEWAAEVRTTAKSYAMSGGHIPGQKLVEVYARRIWYGDEEKNAEFLAALTGKDVDTLRPRKLLTITKAEALLKDVFSSGAKPGARRTTKKRAAELAEHALAHMVEKSGTGNLTLVPSSDPRAEVNAARLNFGQVSVPALPNLTGDDNA